MEFYIYESEMILRAKNKVIYRYSGIPSSPVFSGLPGDFRVNDPYRWYRQG
jgi:hypothetical protein